ncbi:MAG TPA: response regulator, partial [Bdellovibrionota bacterium]|nr:response regulator [Bdellovibrionota bacterium]
MSDAAAGSDEISKPDLLAFSAFLDRRKIVIADTSKTIRTTIARALIELGAKQADLVLASNHPEAVEAIRKIGPDLVFADYHLDARCGLDLIPEHRRVRHDFEKTLFILVTGNATESAIAEAAEGDVDAYILKPFTMETLKRYVVRACLSKIQPTGYRGALLKGRDALVSGKLDEALKIFKEAKALSDKPSMACYYEGQSFEKLEKLESSQGSYQEGLRFNELHYRCSVALFDLHVSRNQLKDAYQVIRKVTEIFPVSPQRLCKTIDIAVRTGHYAEIGRYYDIFIKLDERRDELKKYLSAALLVGGLFQLKNKHVEAGVDLMRKAAITAGDSPAFLRELVLKCLEYDAIEPARQFLKRFPPATQGGTACLSSEYAILDRTAAADEVLVRGRALIKGGAQDPLIYRILIRRS